MEREGICPPFFVFSAYIKIGGSMLTFHQFLEANGVSIQKEAKSAVKVLKPGTRGKDHWLEDLAKKFNKDVYDSDYKNVAYGMPTDEDEKEA
jgi:hypothetical protein